MKIHPAIMAYHDANRYNVIFDTEALSGKKKHVENVIKQGLAIAIAQKAPVDMDFLSICLEHHDDGRVNQFNVYGKFLDSPISHYVLGMDRFWNFLDSHDISIFEDDTSVHIFQHSIMYHGRMALIPNATEETKLYVSLVSAADDFENACSCISYLVKEVENDEKGFIKSNPNADQKTVSDFVFEHFANGEKFDKSIYCNTYAEYVLFAATLATNCIQRYKDFARDALKQPGYGYSSILDGYKDVFSKTLSPETAEKAYTILADMVK